MNLPKLKEIINDWRFMDTEEMAEAIKVLAEHILELYEIPRES